jgi:flavin-dependent dehydrogenase
MGRLYERYLIQCEMAGAQWMPGTRFGGYSRVKQNRLVVRLDNPTRSQSVMTRFLIGADGANSRVARSLSLDVNREWIVGVEDVLTGVPLNDSSPGLHCFLDPRIAPGYLAWVVNDGEETHVGTAGYTDAFNPVLGLEEFKANISSVVDLGFARVLERRSGRIPVGGVLPRICSSDGLLAGDAAGAVSPLTAGGLDPCLRLSTLAARVVVEYLHTQDPDVLREYSGSLFRTRFTSRLWMRRAISTFRNRNLLEVGFAGLRLPLARSFAWHVFFGRGSFPDVGQETEGSLALCE